MGEPVNPKPLVSVSVPVYNHAPYVRECLDSILAQKTNFPFEVIVHDDASTDGSAEIVKEYAEKHPDIIVPILQTENQYSQGIKAGPKYIWPLLRGKYRASCEGDDYWHSPDKLQRQVEIMENDPEVSLACTDADAFIQKTGRRVHDILGRQGMLEKVANTTDMTASLLKRDIGLLTCSFLMRTEDFLEIRQENKHEFSTYFKMGDVQTRWELSRLGRIVVIPESMVTYRVLEESASHSADRMKTFEFYANSLELHEHYVKKFGYGKEMLNAVRRAHYGIFLDVALRLKREDLRLRSLEVIGKVPTVVTLPDRIMAWSAEFPMRFKMLSAVWPAVAFGCKMLRGIDRRLQAIWREMK